MMPDFQRSAEKSQIEYIGGVLMQIQPRYLDIVKPYIEVRGLERLRGIQIERETFTKIYHDLENLKKNEAKSLTTIFMGREYYQSDVKNIPTNRNLAALLPEPHEPCANFVIRPRDLDEIDLSNAHNFHHIFPEITPNILTQWLQFAKLVNSLPPVEAQKQSMGIGGVFVSSVESLFARSYFSMFRHEVRMKSLKYTHLGQSSHDEMVGYHATDPESFTYLLASNSKLFAQKHAEVIKAYGLQSFLDMLIQKAQTFKGDNFEVRDPRLL